jgi:rsbT co-antagonist protein RsbR
MSATKQLRLSEVLSVREKDILSEWLKQQTSSKESRSHLLKAGELQEQSARFLSSFRQALEADPSGNLQSGMWEPVRDLLRDITQTRARQGFTPAETATFVLSLKEALFHQMQKEAASDPKAMMEEIWKASALLDKLGLYTTEVHQKAREEVISRQQQEMLELSTPVVKLWDGVLAVPLIGTLDSARTQVIMENLLNEIVSTGATLAIIDITGVPTVDTLVAQHLLKTVAAARLMGADCIVSGIRPQIAQTIVHLGVELREVITKATLAGAFQTALERMGMMVVKQAQGA